MSEAEEKASKYDRIRELVQEKSHLSEEIKGLEAKARPVLERMRAIDDELGPLLAVDPAPQPQ